MSDWFGYARSNDFADAMRFAADSFREFSWVSENATHDDNISTNEPRPGFIDGGIILAQTFTITKADYIEMELHEWAQLSDWIDSMDNLEVNNLAANSPEMPDIFHVYSVTPTITSLEE